MAFALVAGPVGVAGAQVGGSVPVDGAEWAPPLIGLSPLPANDVQVSGTPAPASLLAVQVPEIVREFLFGAADVEDDRRRSIGLWSKFSEFFLES